MDGRLVRRRVLEKQQAASSAEQGCGLEDVAQLGQKFYDGGFARIRVLSIYLGQLRTAKSAALESLVGEDAAKYGD